MAITKGGNYAMILKNSKMLYMPSCLIVEMLTRLYEKVSRINFASKMDGVIPDLLILLRRLNVNLHCTAEAYQESRIGFFIGDWHEDKARARKMFFNIMSRLGYMNDLINPVEKRLVYKAIETMGRKWAALDAIMERKCSETRSRPSSTTCRYFRSRDPEEWNNNMAHMLIYLDATANYPDADTRLILLCNTVVRDQIVERIRDIEKRSNAKKQFPVDRIQCITDEDSEGNCATCSCAPENRSLTGIRRQLSLPASPTRCMCIGKSLKKIKETQVRDLNRGLAPAQVSGYNRHVPVSS